MKIDIKQGIAYIKIDEEMGIYQAAEIHKYLLECFNKYDSLILDFSNTFMCDTAGIQLICSARKTAQAMKKKFSVVNPSEALINAVAERGKQ